MLDWLKFYWFLLTGYIRSCFALTEAEVDYTKIDNGIYQGGAVDEVPPEINAILNLQLEHEDIVPAAKIKAIAWMPIPDGEFPGLMWLDAAVATVVAYRKAGWNVLIHCAMGMSRSGLVDVAYHMAKNSWSRDQALLYVRAKRPLTNPNPSFMYGLELYEQFLAHPH